MSNPVLDKILEQSILPNATRIAEIAADDQVAVLVFEPSEVVQSIVHALGWDESSPVVRLSTTGAKRMAAASRQMGDRTTERWLLRKNGPVRIFVLVHSGTLLVNFEPGVGYSLEPGSTDFERQKVAS